MITQAVIDAAASTLATAYHAVTEFASLEIFTYWPDPLYNPAWDYLILHEGAESDTVLSDGLRGAPDGSGLPYVPDWLMLFYRQRPVSQQPGVTSQQAQERMRRAKMLLPTIFTRQAGLPTGAPQPYNLGGACLEAGRTVQIRHSLLGPYEAASGVQQVRFHFLAAISIRPSLH